MTGDRRASRRILWLAPLLVMACALIALLIAAYRPALAEITPPKPSGFSPATILRGSELAAIGNCMGCHRTSGGEAFAGGYGVPTPFGTIYSTNISPDPVTGIGRWSLAAFDRAMRSGVSRDGHLLYPAFPYEHFRQMRDQDVAALYAFLMTRTPVVARSHANDVFLPLRFRPLLAAWMALNLGEPAELPDGSGGALVNHGAYLGTAVAHCGACHTPRNVLGGERTDRQDEGGWSGGWYAPALDASSPAVRRWSADRLYAYLTTGLDAGHAAAAGPMGEVVASLHRAPSGDVRAIAAYYARRMGAVPPARDAVTPADRGAAAAHAEPAGAAIFRGACAVCHEPGAAMMGAGRPALQLGTPLHEANPRDTIAIILHGLEPPAGSPGPYMPAYRDTLTDRDVARLTAYLRMRFGSGPAWTDLERQAARARREAM